MTARPFAFALLASLALTGCQPAYDGYFEPGAQPGVTSVRDPDGRRAARFTHNGVTVTVAGDWGNLREEAFTIRYSTRQLVRLDTTGFRLQRPTGTPGDRVVETMLGHDFRTRQLHIDYRDVRSRFAIVRPGEDIRALVSFNDGHGDPDLRKGDQVKLTVPVGDQAVTLTLKAREPWLSFL
jgi:hypothetical protein